MMDLTDKLELLSLADGFTVKKIDDDYEVLCDFAELFAVIKKTGYIEYYKDNCGYCPTELIEVDELIRLKAFCEALVK